MAMYDIKTEELVKNLAEALKGKIEQPGWTVFVKTSHGKERPPLGNNWWYMRSASVLKNVAFLGPIGVSKLRTKYGARKNRGHKPDKFVKGSGKIIRDILQQLEKAGLVKQGKKGSHKGRITTPQGQSLIDKCSFTKKITTKPQKTEKKEIKTEKPKEEEPVKEIKKEEKKLAEQEKAEMSETEQPKKEEVVEQPKEETKEQSKPETEQPKETVEEKKEEIKIKEEPEMSETKASEPIQESPIPNKIEEVVEQPKEEIKEQKIQDKTEKQ